MCAIHGLLGRDPDSRITHMISAATHRGPDGAGQWHDAFISLGHNLLALADVVSKSEQPWVTSSGVLVYNGEIYNYRDLRRCLPTTFHTESDTEVLAAGLQHRGSDFLRKIDGMFALAYYDFARGTVLLARDSNGAKPLYYTGLPDGTLAFSSEIRSLLTLGIPRKVSCEAFGHYYYAGMVAGPLTLFDGIYRLLPGEVREIDTRTGASVSAFNLNDTKLVPFSGSSDDVPDLLSTKLRQAVQLTWTGIRQKGVLLSGGMDSSSVLHEMAHSGYKVRTFSTRFDVPHNRCQHNADADVAEYLAKSYGCKHREAHVTEASWVNNFERAVEALEEPRQGKSYPAYYQTLRQMRDYGVIVAFTGDGGDELLMGYKHQLVPDFRERFKHLRAGHRELTDPAVHITIDEQMDYLNAWLPSGGLSDDPLNSYMFTECMHTLSEDFLIRNDKLGAAFGMETRFPMLCNVFRDFARSLPGEWKKGSGDSWAVANKTLLRKAYRDKLPEQIVVKPKTGWNAPTSDWIIGIPSHPAPDKGVLRDYIRETLKNTEVRDLLGITDDTVEKRYLSQDFAAQPKRSGKPGATLGWTAQKELFTVLTFVVWMRKFNMELW